MRLGAGARQAAASNENRPCEQCFCPRANLFRRSARALGAWGKNRRGAPAEIAALRTGIDLGMTLIDTAEMYGEGATETFLGTALEGVRDRVFLVSKVYPQNAGGRKLINACDASLKRLRTDRLDLYLLHWMGDIPLAETVAGMEALKAAGKIRSWGVSNLDLADMRDLEHAGGQACATDQILYNVTCRGPEFDLLPALASKGITAMAYSPVEQGHLPSDGALQASCRPAWRHAVSGRPGMGHARKARYRHPQGGG